MLRAISAVSEKYGFLWNAFQNLGKFSAFTSLPRHGVAVVSFPSSAVINLLRNTRHGASLRFLKFICPFLEHIKLFAPFWNILYVCLKIV